MKKVICLCFLVLISLLLPSCENSKFDIHETNNEIRLMMEEKAKSEDYWQMRISGTYRSYEKEREMYMANDYDRPIRCYKIQLSDLEKAKEKLLFKDTTDQEHFDKLPEVLKQEIENEHKNEFNLMKSIVNHILLSGSNYDIGTHICDTTKTLKNANMDESTIAYLYIFETGKPIIIVCGHETEATTVAYGTFIINSDYKTLSEARDIFEPYGCSVEIEFEK